MEVIDPAVAVRVPGLTDAVLEGLLGAEVGPMLALGAGVARLTPSLTEAFGRAEVDDFNDAAESGDVTAALVVVVDAGALVAVADESVGLEVAAAVGALGTIEALLDGAGGVAVVACLLGGGIVVFAGEAGAAEMDFLRDDGAEVVGFDSVADV